jgi:predicted metal-dependent phosphoesterase TrpH
MGKYCDLHAHSVFSDGTFTPTELINEGIRQGLSAVALTDHNTTAGLTEFLSAAAGKNILPIPGVEISTEYQGRELHILGLFLPKNKYADVENFVAQYNIRKAKNNEELIARLNAAGYEVDLDEIKKQTPNGHVNRAHIAAELMKKGYVSSVQEGFQELLTEGKGYYFPPQRLTAFETIAFLRDIGAKSVLAHPFLQLTEDEIRVFVQEAKTYGLVGMETLYSKYSDETTEKAIAIAESCGIKQSGGSDFHGMKKPDVSLGVGKGNLRIPYAFIEALQK